MRGSASRSGSKGSSPLPAPDTRQIPRASAEPGWEVKHQRAWLSVASGWAEQGWGQLDTDPAAVLLGG